ncbi:MAG: SDR family NAD(P)-dependent oxidoreductase [Gordonia sp. (in: high G+C Gram-positive bacteria)]|uniref:SDR family NAD(P)-dependent oxidoreductase n=1 Tax=Gordonia sp. (in: high G+C Gram-positive bacteria) TaxID=84139 RepID=UPI0039E4AC3A
MSTEQKTRTIVITGASDGIGAVAARELAGPDVDLVVTGRSADKLARVVDETGATGFTADFTRFADVRALAAEIAEHTGRIDVLINNAGGTFDPRRLTPDGHEPNVQTNHLSPFLLTNLLHDRLAAAVDGALVLNTSSVANRWGRIDLDDLERRGRRPSAQLSYGNSKLMNILFTKGIAQRWSGDGIVSAAVHPGVVATSFGRDTFFIRLGYQTPVKHLIAITPEKGARPLIDLARRGADSAIDGVYFHRGRANGPRSRQADDRALVDGLWAASAELVGLPSPA